MTHLTYTGPSAGQTLCGATREASGQYAHATYCPLDNPDYRVKVCPECLKTWAVYAYDDDDDMAAWVQALRPTPPATGPRG